MYMEQDSIPVGCVPTTAVASTPGQGVGSYPTDTLPPRILYFPKEPGTRDTLPVDRETPMKT